MEEKKPLLGLATTREMLLELKTRGELESMLGPCHDEGARLEIATTSLLTLLPNELLDYKTVQDI